MSELLRRVEDDVPISYGRFELLDGTGLWDLTGDETGSLPVLGTATLTSPARAYRALVRMEAWDGAPPAPAGSWTAARQAVYLSPGGTVSAHGPSHDRSRQMLLLGPPLFAYGLRAYVGPVRTEPAEWDEEVLEPVEEPWLLRFWPLADAASAAHDDVLATMGEMPPPDLTSVVPGQHEWPAFHPPAHPEPPRLIRPTSPPREMERLPTDEFTGRIGYHAEAALASGRRLDEVLGDLRRTMLGNLPGGMRDWSQDMLEDYAAQLHVSRRIGRELNPHGAPTLQLPASDVSTALLGPDPGVSGRAWTWARDEHAHQEVLSVDRQVVARNRIRRTTLLTGIVTILRNENDFVEVRPATAPEAARVTEVETTRT
ncbi:hypothetical protein FDA94_06460 [Herbidospora galbida]|uniref:Uncharacterized protein n=1 Tax=Herbidospora galbida TaxID=2575442 RepID=A0A4V5UZW6_9ACTN|nr:hypothetical protein [Herbidospora galbida]TKK90063.1 hypothetical protein FDA94_06460 [Herbidospora galbida]